MNSAEGEIIRKAEGDIIRAPRRPFPWWGPFDSTNALGRAIVLWGLMGLTGLFVATLGIVETRKDVLGFVTQKQYEITSKDIVYAVYSVFAIAAGMGILLRKRWGVFIVKFMIITIAVAWFFATGTMISKMISIRMDIVKMIIMILPMLVGYTILFLAIPFSIWGYWKKPGIRYEFKSIEIAKLRNSEFDTTKQFANLVILLGIALCLGAYQTGILHILFGFPDDKKFIVLLILIGLLVAGLLPLLGGYFYRKGNNTGRRILRALAVLGIIVWTGLLLFFLFGVGMLSKSSDYRPIQILSLGGLMTFFCIVFVYVFFELFRYLGCRKAMAWCKRGYYKPPWEKQIAQIHENNALDSEHPAGFE
ncbi:MAG: hypothetical protein ACYS8W_04545 [Planctomycetota bacterium]|jgi:hypothetical protein